MHAERPVAIARGIRRFVAPNPSPMTEAGTNSYLVGDGGDLVLIDPGPDDSVHMHRILKALAPGEQIVAIIVTHPHYDHSAGAPAMARLTGAPVLGFGAAGEARSPLMRSLALAGLDRGGEGVDLGFRPDRLLADDEVFSGDWGNLVVHHTPGHMAEHICLSLDATLFSGDHAMGWASSLVSPPDGDMGAYMASLERLMEKRWSLMLPGHGLEVTRVLPRLQSLYRHRRERERAILDGIAGSPASARSLTAQIYRETPTALWPAATRNILAHLIDLHERNEVLTSEAIGPEAIFFQKSREQ